MGERGMVVRVFTIGEVGGKHIITGMLWLIPLIVIPIILPINGPLIFERLINFISLLGTLRIISRIVIPFIKWFHLVALYRLLTSVTWSFIIILNSLTHFETVIFPFFLVVVNFYFSIKEKKQILKSFFMIEKRIH